MTVINIDRQPKPPVELPALYFVVRPGRKLGLFKRLLLSMRQSRRAQAARIVAEHRKIEALLARLDQ